MESEKKKIEKEYEKRIKEIFKNNGKTLKRFKKNIDTVTLNINKIIEKWS